LLRLSKPPLLSWFSSPYIALQRFSVGWRPAVVSPAVDGRIQLWHGKPYYS